METLFKDGCFVSGSGIAKDLQIQLLTMKTNQSVYLFLSANSLKHLHFAWLLRAIELSSDSEDELVNDTQQANKIQVSTAAIIDTYIIWTESKLNLFRKTLLNVLFCGFLYDMNGIKIVKRLRDFS